MLASFTRNLSFLFSLIALLGCGKSAVESFTCSSKDFAAARQALAQGSFLGIDLSKGSDKVDDYLLAKGLNEKMAQVCPLEVLTACAPHHTKADIFNGSVTGPIEIFSVVATKIPGSVDAHVFISDGDRSTGGRPVGSWEWIKVDGYSTSLKSVPIADKWLECFETETRK